MIEVIIRKMIHKKDSSSKRLLISAIVPVYNEEKTVKIVAETLFNNPLITEVICINDASTDASLAELKQLGKNITLINLKKNKGKGNAMAKGIKKARGEIILFMDADLLHLTDEHIEKLLSPILQKKADIVLGCHNYLKHGWSSFTGERVYYKKDLLPYLRAMAKSRFGVELLLNDALKDKKTVRISLKGLDTLLKTAKGGYLWGIKEYLNEYAEILREIARQKTLSLEDYKFINRLMNIFPLIDLVKGVKNPKSLLADDYELLVKLKQLLSTKALKDKIKKMNVEELRKLLLEKTIKK
jgi:glycosyltransferase involved in cell wall biosynthesis